MYQQCRNWWLTKTISPNIMDSTLCFMLLVVLGVVGSAFSEAGCPKRKDVYPCSCHDMDDDLELFCHDEDISKDNLTRIMGAFNKSRTLNVDLYYIDMGVVPTDYFEGYNIRVLAFAHCDFRPIPDEEGRILVGLEDTLEEFSVVSSITRENSPTKLDMSHLNKLTKIIFSHNTIPQLTDDWFAKGPSQLTHLYLNDNEIENLGYNAFAHLPNLEKVWLDGNKFGQPLRSMFSNPANHLDDLQLDENNLESLPDNFLTNMPALTSLSLEDNKFTVLPEETFGKIWGQLEYLDMGGNPLYCDDSVLQWMFDRKDMPAFSGICARPPFRKGEHIWDLITENH